MSAMHTKGPWRRNRRVIESDSGVICDVWSHMGIEEADANERLIAAAPELLEVAVSNAEYRAERDSEFGRGYNAAKNGQSRNTQKESADWYAGYDARTAIAKATGDEA